ncbi:hypothetical protein FRC07_006771 [Ceratobasidium sp. 392]|nr:hypothetical protein FRC07_006771 [Ceratobasidium sp. 392]
MASTQVVSQYAYNRPKGMRWSPKPLALAKRYPLRPIAERTSFAKLSTAPDAVQPVLKVQNEHHEESALIEADNEGASGGQAQGQTDSFSSDDSCSPAVSSGDLPAPYVGVSPEDFLRNALPSTYTFAPTSPVDHRLGVTSPHRLRPSSSMSNISSSSNKSRPPSVMSISGQMRRSSSRTSGFSDPPSLISSVVETS